MFKLIGPKDYPYYRGRIDLLMGLMQLGQDIPLSYEEQSQSTFVVGEGEEGSVLGGAILNKRPVSDLAEEMQTVMSEYTPNRDYVWVGTLALCLEKGRGFSSHRDYPQLFYKSLLKKLNEFGDKEDIGFLYLTLNSREYLRTKNRELWPYALEVTPQTSLDGLFHGVLPLPAQEAGVKAPVHTWEKREFSSQAAHLGM